ncbi:MAG: co-chaperone DjlA [Gammaproteobacteria bacterium]|nr:MAG: co-chaperone DjlA [Gammaproteobacteria bacterium]
MPYWGKLIGTMVGLATGRPWLALLGLILGHQFDRGFAQRFSRLGGDGSAAQLGHLPESYLRVLFETIGHLAKADGRVSEDEIRAARRLMHRLGLGPVEIRHAIGWFEQGKPQAYPLVANVRSLRRHTARRPELRGLFVRLLLEVALSKSALRQRERAVIWAICSELDIGRVELAQLEAMLRAQRRFRQSPQGSADTARVDDAYRVLGVNQEASNAEIKQAYRRLMNKNHPDKLAAANPGPAQIEAAGRKTRQIRGAWDLLKARRSIR